MMKPKKDEPGPLVLPCACGQNGPWAYLLADKTAGSAYVIDPGPDPGPVIDVIEKQNFLIKGVICTRATADAASALEEVSTRYRVPVLGHLTNPLADLHVSEGDECLLGSFPLRFFHTPGTGCDAVCIRCADQLFTGDTLLIGGIGPSRGLEMVLAHFDSLQRLMQLDETLLVRPRLHFGQLTSSTLGRERRENSYLKALDDIRFFPRLLEWEMTEQKWRKDDVP